MIKFVTVWFFVFNESDGLNVATIPTMSKTQCENTIKQFQGYDKLRFKHKCIVGQIPVYAEVSH